MAVFLSLAAIAVLELVRPDGRGWLICPLPGRKETHR